jgi:hypothetical protein
LLSGFHDARGRCNSIGLRTGSGLGHLVTLTTMGARIGRFGLIGSSILTMRTP